MKVSVISRRRLWPVSNELTFNASIWTWLFVCVFTNAFLNTDLGTTHCTGVFNETTNLALWMEPTDRLLIETDAPFFGGIRMRPCASQTIALRTIALSRHTLRPVSDGSPCAVPLSILGGGRVLPNAAPLHDLLPRKLTMSCLKKASCG
ncbi:hypothetical protein DPMN_131722 [Dreissena polymorpha]|uniref:Uncharacterized protein n=1 Tax=Dreissena polymorpha TaxID=45954 RepID=A0A9D4FSH1_DREPO|nr:hypothetical protein DPMN_131722 [Dreissena polymorpha]